MIVADGSPPAQRDQLGTFTLGVTTMLEDRCAYRCCVPNGRSSSARVAQGLAG